MLPEGYTSVPARPEMAPELTALITRYDTRNGAMQDFQVEDMREIFREPLLDPERDTLLITRDSEMAACTMLWQRLLHERAVAFGVVDPAHLGVGLGAHLADFIERRAREIQTDGGKTLRLHWFVEVDDAAANDLALARGFAVVRGNYTMRIEFDGSPISVDVPDWMTLRNCTPEDLTLCHRLIEETFAEHFGHTSRSYEEWYTGLPSRDDYDQSLWWLAFEGDEPAGILTGFLLDDETGWVADLGVREPYRKRGIGAVLLRTAFAEFQRRGMKAVGLGVDAQNETRAVALYERAGMSVARAYWTYEKNYS
ncbi:MAG: GNAT family N-acetyltransferase [Actinomycetota bacterium]